MSNLTINLDKLILPAQKFEVAKAEKIAVIKAKGDSIFNEGFAYDFGSADGIQHLQLRPGTEDKSNWQTVGTGCLLAIVQGAGDLEGPTIRTAENNNITMTYNEAAVMIGSLIAWGQNQFQIAWAKQNAVAAAVDQDELDAVDVDSGWTV